MFVPIRVIVVLALTLVTLLVWALLAAHGRNPLPFPDPGSRIFAASSPQAKNAVVALLAKHGIEERFQMNSSGILRSLMMDGTIINVSPPQVTAKLGGATSSIGLVAQDPNGAARDAATFLRQRGFAARVVLGVEPNLPIAFVVTDAFAGTVLNFRKHATQMPQPN